MEAIFEFLVKGGILMIPIGLCSVIGLGIFLERLWALQRSKVVPTAFMTYLEKLISEQKYSEAEALAASADASVANVVRVGLHHRGRRREVLKESFEEAGRHEVAELERHVPALGTIANIAPLLGLLGTVQGMIVAFQRVVTEVADRSSVDPGHLAAGIWTALITTAAGLAVAIPIFLAYKFLLSRIDRLALEMEEYTLQLVDLLDGEAPRPPIAQGPAGSETVAQPVAGEKTRPTAAAEGGGVAP